MSRRFGHNGCDTLMLGFPNMSESYDIAVVGSGAAGLAAAVSAGRAGCRTLLLDRHPLAGGTGGFSGLTTLCGL